LGFGADFGFGDFGLGDGFASALPVVFPAVKLAPLLGGTRSCAAIAVALSSIPEARRAARNLITSGTFFQS
jgi:hypothetical protein